jgi:hypothetical protein
MTVADLAELLDVDWHQAARLVDPKRSSKLTTLTAALGVLNCEVVIAISEEARTDDGAEAESELYRKHIERGWRQPKLAAIARPATSAMPLRRANDAPHFRTTDPSRLTSTGPRGGPRGSLKEVGGFAA